MNNQFCILFRKQLFIVACNASNISVCSVMMMMIIIIIIIIITIIITLLKEDNIFGRYASLTYGPQLTNIFKNA